MAKKALHPIDTDVKIPPSILAASAKADELHKLAYPTEAPTAVVEPAEPAEPAAPAPEPAAATAIQAPVTHEVVQPSAPAAPAEQSWEHKYNSMKGRFDRSEVANRRMNERLGGLEQVIATMATAEPVPAEVPASVPGITAEERAAYGDEFLSVAARAAREQISPEVAELKSQVKNLSARLESVGVKMGQSDRDRMHDYLTTHCPNWLATNDNPEFISWLALPAPYSNAIKLTLLKASYAANDGPGVLAFFQGFLSEEAALAPQPERTPTPAQAAAKVPLETFAAPGRAKTAATHVPAEKPIFTRADISQFYVDVANKKYVGREAEKDRIDREIVAAGREGRIR